MNPHIQEVLDDPAGSNWLRSAIRSAMQRDPVDVANDLDVLILLFGMSAAAEGRAEQ